MQNYKDSKKKKLAIRFFTYGVMTVATIAVSAICIFLALGYRFDAQSRSVEQGGLYQFRSFPSNAKIVLDGKNLSFRTPGKYNIAAGQHTIVMSKTGYQEWRKTAQLQPGELRWLNYARLVPTSISTTTEKSFPAIAGTLPSPDRRWIVLQTSADAPEFTLVDVRNPDKPLYSNLAIPATAVSKRDGVTSSFELMEWDFGARYALVKHTLSDGLVEFIRIDRTDASQAINISTKFSLPFSSMHFSGTSGGVFYALSGTDLRKIDLSGDGTIGAPLVQGVASFELYKTNVIAYSALHDDKRVVGVYKDGKDTIIRSYSPDTKVVYDVSSYFDHIYLAVSGGPKVEIIKDPLENTDTAGRAFATVLSAQAPGWLTFSNSGRFAVSGIGGDFTTYDLETDETYSANLGGAGAPVDRPLKWLDDYYLVSTTGGKLTIGEFDGANQHSIGDVTETFPVTLSENGEYIFSAGKTDAGAVLQASRMILGSD